MDKAYRLKELTEQLNKASYAYYGKDKPIMSDKQYDDLYDELVRLEKETGIILAGSPTQKVQGYVLDGFKKVKHSKPMLSADKTKETNDIQKFVQGKDYYGSFKMDGLTLVVKYNNGQFIQGISRGNGVEGEDVTEQCKFIKNLPMTIPYKDYLEVRGECVISWEEFDRINQTLENPYSHPRNLAAGTLRNLDLNVVKNRNLSFLVFECVTDIGIDSKLEVLMKLSTIGFEVVMHTLLNCPVDAVCDGLTPDSSEHPVDGIIFEIDSRKLSEKMGSTSHHECCRMALKWADELYETTLTDIEWNTSKSGLVNPVAVFEPVDLDGAITTRATLHNITYIEDLELGIGDTIQVYRANMVIPKVHNNLTRSNTFKLPDKCPCCGGNVEIHNENGSKTLHCTNPDCEAKLLTKLVHYCSKNAMNIENMSEATLQFLIDKEWVKSSVDLYTLDWHWDEWIVENGFGRKSVLKLLENIAKSKTTTLDKFLYSLSIPMIGKSASKDIAKLCKYDEIDFRRKIIDNFDFTVIDGVGDTLQNNLDKWFDDESNMDMYLKLVKEITFEKPDTENKSSVDLTGKVFVITGSLEHYSNRNELVSVIENLGGKVSGSVSAKTTALINNDKESNSSKNKKAKELGIKILSEQDFSNMIS